MAPPAGWGSVESIPYRYPYDGKWSAADTALIIIDMQVDFCGVGGYVDRMGYDISLTRAAIAPIQSLLAECRKKGIFVIHTREGHRSDLCDLSEGKLWRSAAIGAGIGSAGPTGRVLVRGEPGWDFIPELKPLPTETIIEKPGKGSFYATDLQCILDVKHIRNLILTGITTDVCVHTTMRDANDRGYECVIVSDCTAATDYGNHLAALKMVTMQGGVFGTVATSDAIISAMNASAPTVVPKPMLAAPPPPKPAPAGTVTVPRAQPSAYSFDPAKTALVMIDFQVDFCEPGGFGASLGNDVSKLASSIAYGRALLEGCRAAGIHVVHTLEAHKADLSDCPPAKLSRGDLPKGLRIGDVLTPANGRILVRDEPGNAIVKAVAPIASEKVVFKPGKGAFYATDLQEHLQARGMTHLIFAGVTTEVCVQTSMREANDRGYECLLAEDAAGSYFPEFHLATLAMIRAQGGIVGWHAPTASILRALSSPDAAKAGVANGAGVKAAEALVPATPHALSGPEFNVRQHWSLQTAVALSQTGGPLEDLPWAEFVKDNVDIVPIYGFTKDSAGKFAPTTPDCAQAAFLRYKPGGKVPPHRHRGDEHITVLRGSQSDENGRHCAGEVCVNREGSCHTVHSMDGCIVFINWVKPVEFI